MSTEPSVSQSYSAAVRPANECYNEPIHWITTFPHRQFPFCKTLDSTCLLLNSTKVKSILADMDKD